MKHAVVRRVPEEGWVAWFIGGSEAKWIVETHLSVVIDSLA